MSLFFSALTRFFRTILFGTPDGTLKDAISDGTSWGMTVGENLAKKGCDNFDKAASFGRKTYKKLCKFLGDAPAMKKPRVKKVDTIVKSKE